MVRAVVLFAILHASFPATYRGMAIHRSLELGVALAEGPPKYGRGEFGSSPLVEYVGVVCM